MGQRSVCASAAIGVIGAIGGLLLAAATALPAHGAPKVLVLGFDGADPELVQEYMDRGLMPNFEALAQQGTFSPLLPTNPAQTPVSWAAFSTGFNPGRTGIYDFLQREAGSYAPDFALAKRLKKTFALGAYNGWLLAGVAGLLCFLVFLVVLRFLRVRAAYALGSAAAAGLVATLALAGPASGLLPAEVPDAVNNRQGTPFWTLASKAGWKVAVTHMPVTFPAEPLPGASTMISGLGVPDMRGRVGTPTYFTSDPAFSTGKNNEFSLELTRLPARRGPIETTVIGPFNYPFHVYVIERERERWKRQGASKAEIVERERDLAAQLERTGAPRRLDLPLRLDIADDRLTWAVGNQRGTLRPGEWTDWVVFEFPINWLVDRVQPVRGMGRFKLISLEPEVALYLSPINFHVSCHPVAYSWPPDWAQEVAGHVGLFKTIGWTIDTWSYPSGVGGIDLFAEDMWFTVDASNRILEHAYADPDMDMIVHIFDFTDRAGHMLWHELDRGHPLFRPELEAKYRAEMERVYRRMDELVGRAREMVAEDGLLLVVSDHGFSSFRRQINYNTWLYQHGYLALTRKPAARDLEQLFDKDVTGVNVFSGIDWSRTKAWAMGLGGIYLNVVGREPSGVVMPGAEYDAIVSEIKQGLESEVDPATGVKPVVKVYHRDEIYHSFDPARVPDLRPANARDYRVSWQDTLGGISTDVFEDNDRLWSGDHCSLEPELVRGIVLVNRKLRQPKPTILDLAPSILAEIGLRPETSLDGKPIW